MAAPSEAAIYERAKSLCNRECFTIALQRRRLRTVEPEDDVFIFRWWADLQFMIVALRRLRRAAQLATKISHMSGTVSAAIRDFDLALPGLAKMRNVGEHIDDYALDNARRHHADVDRKQLQVGMWDGTTFHWLDSELNIDHALDTAMSLFETIKSGCVTNPQQKGSICPKSPTRFR